MQSVQQIVNPKLFSPEGGEKIALSENERIAEFLHFAYVNRLQYAERAAFTNDRR